MAAKVILNVTNGKRNGKEFAFNEPTKCVVGRSHDCAIQLPDDWEYRDISRHHCELEINPEATPPSVRVRDLGSLNGTFINGRKIGGQRSHFHKLGRDEQSPDSGDLREGDELKVGHVVIRVKA